MSPGDPSRPGSSRPRPPGEPPYPAPEADPALDLAAALHEVSNALTVVLGWADAARHAKDAAAAAAALDIVLARAAHARDIARRAIGAPASPEGASSVAAVAADAALGLSVEAQRAQVTIDVQVDPPARGLAVRAGPWLLQVLTNLLLNAIAFSPSGAVVRLSVGVAEGERASSGERASVGASSVERASVGASSVERASVGVSSGERAAVERASVGVSSGERASVGVSSVERASVERASVERASVGVSSGERASVGVSSGERAAVGVASGERASVAGPSRVLLRVDDAGPGIAPEMRERLFEAGVTSRRGGAGIGLRHSAALAARAGGALRLGEVERGTRFELLWPVACDDDDGDDEAAAGAGTAPQSAERLVEARPSIDGARILVVEDDDAVIELLELALEARGASVVSVRERAGLARALASGRFDAVLLDMSPLLGDVEGAVEELRRASPGARVVVMSGSVPSATVGGAVMWVRKPFEVREIVEALGSPPPARRAL